MSDKWTDKLREELSDYEAPVPEEVWAGIIAHMDAKPKVVWWKRVASYTAYPVAAALLLLVGYVIFMRTDVVRVADNPIVAERSHHEIIETSDLLSDPDPVIVEAEGSPSTPEVVREYDDRVGIVEEVENSKSVGVVSGIDEKEELATSDEDTMPEIDESTKGDTVEEEISKSGKITIGPDVVPSRRSGSSREQIVISSRRKDGHRGQMTVGLYASNFATQGSSTHRGFGDHFPDIVQSVARGVDVSYKSVKEEIRYLNSVQETKVTTEHGIPIKLGFRFSYYLTDRLAIESGVTATRLSTKVTSGTIQYRTETEYQMYLIGVPLSLKYQIWGTNHWGFYTLVGGAMESRISSRASTEYSLDATVVRDPAVNQNSGGARLLWSLRGGVGANYSVGPHLGLFIEPGVTYYLDRQILMEATQMTTPVVPTITIGLNLSY